MGSACLLVAGRPKAAEHIGLPFTLAGIFALHSHGISESICAIGQAGEVVVSLGRGHFPHRLPHTFYLPSLYYANPGA
jgi:hypothetical protein